ncbi:hypothetical protein V1478_014218 [Vespula squamosa]|uniref:C2H2-type domain-containing protein n=1 Tax=Vespula squamosa TaxID=30214 RepID=A0ABD2A850_VESSQ
MAQWFRRKFHIGKDSMKHMRRSLTKRAVRRIKEVKLYDTSMVNNKEDFMNIIGLKMKRQQVENNVERNNNVIVKKKDEEEEEEEEKENSSGTLKIRKCSVVIVAERCKICNLPFKCKSDVIFHTVMRHGNDSVVSDHYIETNTVTKKQRSNTRRRKTPNNNNQFRLKIKIGDEVISDITMNRKHLKILNSSSTPSSFFPPKIIDSENRKNEDSIKAKNNSKSSLVGIDCFGSTKNHYKDYVMGVQPLNHIHMLDDSLLNEGFQNDDGNRSKHVIDVQDKNTAYCDEETVFFRLPLLCSLSEDMINNNKNSYITNISSIGECNTFDKENIVAKTQSVKNVNIDQSMEATKMHLASRKEDDNKVDDYNDDDADDDEIQEILRITKRRRTNNENVIRKLDDSPLNRDRMLPDSEKKMYQYEEEGISIMHIHSMIYH